MTLAVSDAGSVSRYTPPTLLREPSPSGAPAASPAPSAWRPEPGYHPQVQPPVAKLGPDQGQGGTSPYALPADSTLAQTAGGTAAQPFDVTLSQLATAVYGTRGDPPPGWNAVSDAQIAQGLGIAPGDPNLEARVEAWRQQFLGGGTQTTAQEFKAEVYTDGEGNFVLSYRGTAEGAADWENNFDQGLGFQTDTFADKFSDTAVNTAMEFARVFGDGPANSNLAITGHSQGGGLASVGSLASGIPAVTFDASGIHPNTLDRMGFTPEQARGFAENGGIRAYSLDSDALSQAQESWVTGLVAPDALGTRIIVSPGAANEHTVVARAADKEFDLPAPVDWLINGGVEWARHSGIPLVDQAGDLAYAAFSHNPNVLTAAMVEQQPWQAGYQNPSDTGRDLQNLLPDPLKDDYARNTHDFVTDIGAVNDTYFSQGRYVEGGFHLLGDFAEGAFNSTGDTVDAGFDGLARQVEARVGGPFGTAFGAVIDGGGDVIEAGTDLLGGGAELLSDGMGWLLSR
jgi:hypothetical protein